MQEVCFNKPKDKWRPYKMANDSEATRAAGINWTNDEAVVEGRHSAARIIGHSAGFMKRLISSGDSLRWIELAGWIDIGPMTEDEVDAQLWRIARRHPTVVGFEAQHRPVREDRGFTPASPEDRAVISDLMREAEEHNGRRDTTDAVSGEKTKHKSLEWGTNCLQAPDRGPHECAGGGQCGEKHVCLRCGCFCLCQWCNAGNPRIASSVSDRMVHTDTPRGRVACLDTPSKTTPKPVAPDSGKDAFAYVHRAGNPLRAVKWTGENIEEVRLVFPGIGEEYMLDKGCQIGNYAISPRPGRVYFESAEHFESRYERAALESKTAPQGEVSYRAEFLWPHEDDSIEEAGYEFANGKTEEYRKQWWDNLIVRIHDTVVEARKKES